MKTLMLILMAMITLKTQSQAPGRHDAKHEHHGGGTFQSFIFDPGLYREDVAEIMNETIANFGEEEWRAVALTVEIHGHLGIYAIIGAKMGVLARELLMEDVDEIRVTSLAGSKTPLSCLNDGLQVSTGATVGHGSITISDNTEKSPAAAFTAHGKTIRITLKEEYCEETDRTLRELFQRCGGLTDEYWLEVRKLGIKCWKEMDRKETFLYQF